MMEVACTRIIAQALPLEQHFVFVGSSQLLNTGETLHEAMPVGRALVDACLLKNNLTQPDSIGIGGLTPWKTPAMFCKP